MTPNVKHNKPIALYIGAAVTVLSIVGLITGYVNKSGAEVSSTDKLVVYSLITLLTGLVITGVGIANAKKEHPVHANAKASANVIILAQGALLAALAYVGFSYFRIDIPVGPGSTSFHLGNTFVVLAALLLGGPWGGLAGAIGLSLADITSGKYFTTAPQTFFLKLCIGLITGLIAHQIFKISKQKKEKAFTASIIASVAGLGFNVIADPVVGFFYKKYILGLQSAVAINWAKMSAATTLVNAIASVIAAVVLYNALRPALISAGLFLRKED